MSQDSTDLAESRYRRVAIIIIMLGVTMSAVDTTAVVLGLPVMMQDLHSDILSMVWVLLAYLLVITILGTQVGKLGDMFGRVRMYNLGFAVFTFGSLLCGISSDGTQLIAFRVLQGIGGALISSNSGAIIADTFSQKERGKAFGITGMGWSIGAILGILIGGAFVTFLNWRYIFFINLPIGVAATVAGYYLLKERSPRKKETVDLGGICLLGLSLFLILYALTSITGSGLTPEYTTDLIVGALTFIGFVLWEWRSKSPFLDLSLFHDRIFRSSSLAAFFQSLASYAVIFLVIMYLQGPRGMTPWDASLLLIPGYVLGGLIAPFAGRLSDTHGARVIASIGLGLQIGGILVFSILDLNTPVYLIILGSVLNGAGTSSFFPANTSAVMANAPPKSYGISAGLLRTMSNLGMVCSFAVALFFASISIPRDVAFQIFLGVGGLRGDLASAFIDGMHSALFASIVLLVVAFFLSVLRGKEARTNMDEPRSAK
ncbi:MAG: MFS transporter [Methanomassiliicoccales archaeon]|jgi:EmrB/QacA subfamily drug resistance transporter